MITFNKQQKTKIKSLKPLTDSKFTYNTKKWSKLNENFRHLIKDFENKEIGRQDIINAYQDYYNNSNTEIMKAFLLTMVWGFTDTGYGTYRTNNYISSKENRLIIKNAVDFIKINDQNSLKNAFNELMKIKGLGVSYLTKILYFSTRAISTDNYALIFDIRVASSLLKLTTPKEIYQILTVNPSSKFEDYKSYNTVMYNIAKDNSIEADQLEMYLFNQDFI